MSPTSGLSRGAIELVVFKLKDGVGRREFVGAAEMATGWIEAQPGFVSRDLSEAAADDRWVEVIWWSTMAQAEAAAEAAMTSESCAPMFSMIDPDSVMMVHGEPALTVAAG